MTGEGQIQAGSVRDFTRWSGLELPFGAVMQAISVAGDFSMDRRRLTWPSATITLGKDKLEGTIGVRFDAERPIIAGTLAADSLDLSEFSQPLAQARTSSGAWSEEIIDLSRATGSDLDLRLSASSATMGRLHFEDIAASVLVRPGRIEASIGRAELNKGTVKGRLSIASVDGVTEFKSQATFNEIDLDPFLAAAGARRWITGQAQGQFAIEGSGRTPLEIVRHAKGRSSVVVKQGEIVGVALDDALRRVEKRPLWTSLTWKGGRTPFDQAQANLAIRDGMGEVVDGRLQAPTLVAHLQGHVSLVDRTVDLKADVSPANPVSKAAPVIGFELTGGWSSVVVTPDARALIERSGAAKPLFGPDRLLPNGATPLATAQ